jgi:hypothetical protein
VVASTSSSRVGVGQARDGHRAGRSASVEAPEESNDMPRPMGVGLAKAGWAEIRAHREKQEMENGKRTWGREKDKVGPWGHASALLD